MVGELQAPPALGREMAKAMNGLPPGARYALEFVTPDQALSWLETVNTNNRPLMSARVASYASDMRAGRWEFNGMPICFDLNGVLLDGQHRLWACAESGVGLWFLIVRGLPSSAQNTIDLGAKRTAGQIASLNGIPNSTQTSAIARLVLIYDRHEKNFRGSGTRRGPTTAEITEYLIAHSAGLEAAVKIAYRCRQLQATVCGFCYFVFSRIDAKAAEIFFDKLINGGQANTDPLFHLRERLLQFHSAKYRAARTDIIGLFFKTWNYWRSGRQIRALSYKSNEELQVIE